MSRLRNVLTALMSTMAIAAAAGCSDDGAAPAGAGGAGGSGGSMAAPDAGAVVCPAGGPVDPTTLIDDFEDMDSRLPPLAGRLAAWFATGDGTTAAIMNPLGDAPPEAIPGGRCGSRRALHVTGSGFDTWGSLVGVALHYGPNSAGVGEELPYDARARGYQGISFFARVGETSQTTVRFAVSDEYARPEAGLCKVNGAPTENCYDTFGVPLTYDLNTQWTEFRIPWTGMSQRDFGLQGGIAPDVSKLYDISFNFPEHSVFDLWVDDVRFF